MEPEHQRAFNRIKSVSFMQVWTYFVTKLDMPYNVMIQNKDFV